MLYTPLIAVVAFGIVVSCAWLVNEAGPDHTYVYGVVPLNGADVSVIVVPAQYAALLLDAVIDGD